MGVTSKGIIYIRVVDPVQIFLGVVASGHYFDAVARDDLRIEGGRLQLSGGVTCQGAANAPTGFRPSGDLLAGSVWFVSAEPGLLAENTSLRNG